MSYKVSFSTRWADFDPNNHMRHSAYNDYAAEARVRFFRENGFSMIEFNKQNIGPVLFSENTNFYREINLSENISVELFVKGLSENGERFKFQHKIYKQNGVLAAEIEIYGAWINLKKRKLTEPPKELISKFEALEKADNFEVIPIKMK
ncbi:MAG: thioesterase family protein [Flavobacteriaceae bacterium]|nr:thioesterase family protein [Flavobacteriaceae bacterium]